MPKPEPRKPARAAPPPRGPGLFSLHAPAEAPAPRWLSWAAYALIAAAGAVMLLIALGPHKVGDYFTETDFYGAYADGARLLQQGHLDPSRYTVVGPVYEMALALAGFVVRDLFTAGELLSVVAMVGTLLLWWVLLRRRAGAAFGLWTVAFLAVNPTLQRYGFSATTDALATLLQAAALFAILALRGPRAPLWAGLLAALAFLTRYNAIYLVPGALAAYLWLAPPAQGTRRRATLLFVAGFAALVVPWLLFSLGTGQAPGTQLFHNIAFDVYGNAQGITWDEYQSQLQPQFHSLWDVIRRDPGAVARRELHNVLEHLKLDALLLLRLPVAVLCVSGLILAWVERSWRRLLPLWAFGAVLFATLVPVIHSERYSLPLLPLYLTLAAAFVSSPRFALKLGPVPLKWVLALWPFLVMVESCIVYQQRLMTQLPVEVMEVGRTLHERFPQGGRIMARKPHVAYYSGMKALPFPSVNTLPELAAAARRLDIGFLYFSWPEAQTRPRFWYLLDTSGVVPGLEVVQFTRHNPAVAYRIGKHFGETPAWFANDTLFRLHVAQAQVLVNPAEWQAHLSLGLRARQLERFDEALAHFQAITQYRPRMAQGWILVGEAYLNTGRVPEAYDAYSRAVELDPTTIDGRVGLGWAQLQSGRPREAAESWKEIIEYVEDPTTLQQMALLYERLGDARSAGTARARLSRLLR